ncbi:MAG: DMT family transporter [Candidatus Nomurabacteria bacterium]|jgi:drug/metabolite transporter (DMT)-like permease|nr:DMT family transporter [Candidatus Nomurabacteria bacterium]
MTKTKTKKQPTRLSHWLALGIFSQLLYLPTSIFTKLLTNDLDPSVIVVARYSMASLVFLPLIIYGVYKHRKAVARNLKLIVFASLMVSMVPLLHAMTLSMADVSFVMILHMLSPIVFTILSIMIIKDRISRHALIGLLFAILGGAVVLVLPTVLGSGKVITFGWLPVILAAIVMVITQLWTVCNRKINESGVPLPVIAGLGLMAHCVVGLVVTLANGGFEALDTLRDLPQGDWMLLVYLAMIGSVVGSLLPIKIYEKIGTAAQTTLDYLYYVFVIIIPVVALGETLSLEMIIGAVLIMIGIIFTQVHHSHKGHGAHHRHAVAHK